MKASRYRILWKGQISGPFDRVQVEEMLSKNEIGVWAEISEGNSDWKPISEWRIREPAFEPAPKIEKQVSKPAAAFRLHVSPDSNNGEDTPDLPPLPEGGMYQGSGSNVTTHYSGYEDGTHPKGFFYWTFIPFKKFGIFSGRARRKEYWLFTLINTLVGFAIGFAEVALGGTPEESVFIGLYTLFIIIPSLAVTVRRLHDTNRSGWWTLIILFPVLGSLLVLLFVVQEGTEGENDFGLDPKAESVT